MPPRAIRERSLPISSIDIHVQRTLDDVGVEVIVEVDESDDFTFELTDTFGKEQYVRTDNNKILDRSQTTSLEVHEMLTNLALTRDEKIRLRLAKATGVETLLEKLGPMSPLIESGLSNNAQSIKSTSHYDFTVEDVDTGEYLDATAMHSTVRSPFGVELQEGSESFSVNVTWRKQDGGVKKTGVTSLEISQSVDPDANVRTYSLEKESGTVEIIDGDFLGTTSIEVQDISEILETVSHAFNTETAARTIEKHSDHNQN